MRVREGSPNVISDMDGYQGEYARSIEDSETLGDVSNLADPSVVEAIISGAQTI